MKRLFAVFCLLAMFSLFLTSFASLNQSDQTVKVENVVNSATIQGVQPIVIVESAKEIVLPDVRMVQKSNIFNTRNENAISRAVNSRCLQNTKYCKSWQHSQPLNC